ncbi:MAG: glycosyltransferase family 2 protein [Pikeienuella sp.]
MQPSRDHLPALGVVIVTYCAADFIADCLESLLASGYPALRIAVVDNASPDGTAEAIADWAAGTRDFIRPDDWADSWPDPVPKPLAFVRVPPGTTAPRPFPQLALIEAGANLGFAGGVNLGLRALAADRDIDHFWILNPDTLVPPQTPEELIAAALGMDRYAVIGARIVFRDAPATVQMDGGRINRLTGTSIAVNLGQPADTTPLPDASDLDFISGGHMLASRDFLDRAGLMEERYFLYYEEVDWQLRRGDLPLGFAAGAEIRHSVGVSIGSGGRSLTPAPFSVYFMSRNLLVFVARWFPWRLPFAYLLAYLRLARHWDGSWAQISAMLRGLHRMGPPQAVRTRLPEATWARVLGRRRAGGTQL